MLNALSIDFEEWYHPELVKDYVGETPRERRAGQSVRSLLELLKSFGHKCTFFLLSDALEAYPDLIVDIVAAGHELGYHGHTHRVLAEHTPATFDAEIKTFLRRLDDLGLGLRIKGYRAPTFSINQSTSWALSVLEGNGFLYDSSIFPITNPYYGVAGAPLGIYCPDPADLKNSRDSGIVEFPLSTAKIGPLRIPIARGFYFRVLPFMLSRRFINSIISQGRPFLFYFHPWEVDPGIPRVRLSPFASWVTYAGLDHMAEKVERLLGCYQFTRMDEILGV